VTPVRCLLRREPVNGGRDRRVARSVSSAVAPRLRGRGGYASTVIEAGVTARRAKYGSVGRMFLLCATGEWCGFARPPAGLRQRGHRAPTYSTWAQGQRRVDVATRMGCGLGSAAGDGSVTKSGGPDGLLKALRRGCRKPHKSSDNRHPCVTRTVKRLGLGFEPMNDLDGHCSVFRS
jgi:hypothetical protein